MNTWNKRSRGPQVCQLFSCYVSPSINKVLIIIIIIKQMTVSHLFWVSEHLVEGSILTLKNQMQKQKQEETW